MDVKRLAAPLAIVAMMLALAAPASAGRAVVFPGGCCFYEGDTVRTVVPPAAFPNRGTDAFYAVMGGVEGQKGVVAVAPGEAGYHGGHWAFNAVTWKTDPYLLTSEAAVWAAEAASDVEVTRDASHDFLCPIQI